METVPTPPAVEFTAYGVPKPQGSMKSHGFIRKSGPNAGKIGVNTSHSASTMTWRGVVDQVVQRVADGGAPMLDGPIVASMRFYLPRPKSAPKRTRTWPIGYPDLTKLARAVEDCMIGVLIRDDSRIVTYRTLTKDYAEYSGDERPRVEVALWRLVHREAAVVDGVMQGPLQVPGAVTVW